MEETKPEEGVDLRLEGLIDKGALGMSMRHYLGSIAAQFLNSPARLAAFMADEEGNVILLDPLYVKVLHGAIETNLNRPFKWVAPVIGEGPQHVAMKNGALWLIEYTDQEGDQHE
jgi:hypothetical protein